MSRWPFEATELATQGIWCINESINDAQVNEGLEIASYLIQRVWVSGGVDEGELLVQFLYNTRPDRVHQEVVAWTSVRPVTDRARCTVSRWMKGDSYLCQYCRGCCLNIINCGKTTIYFAVQSYLS